MICNLGKHLQDLAYHIIDAHQYMWVSLIACAFPLVKSVVEVVVMYDYDAKQANELTLRVGQVIKNVHKVDEGWAKGELLGIVGMFPDNFVKMREELPEEHPPPQVTKEGLLVCLLCIHTHSKVVQVN